MNYNIILGALSEVGLRDIEVLIRDNFTLIHAMDYKLRPNYEIDLSLSGNSITIDKINFNFNKFNIKNNTEIKKYFTEKSTNVSLNALLVFLQDINKKYGKIIKKTV